MQCATQNALRVCMHRALRTLIILYSFCNMSTSDIPLGRGGKLATATGVGLVGTPRVLMHDFVYYTFAGSTHIDFRVKLILLVRVQ